MKKHLLPEKGLFYKANMHVHTTLSDGPMTPEETKRVYAEAGYSIIAYTDHNLICPHNDLSDAHFLAINSIEIDASETLFKEWTLNRVYHFNLFSKDPNRTKPFLYDREYSVDWANKMIARANSEGFLVCYNHPVWSKQNYEDYSGLKGLWGVENYNTGCVLVGDTDTMQPIDDLLRKGEKVFPVATDDTHVMADLFGGWIMVKAENLQYDTVMNALERGDFYASTGPQIHDLSIEDGILHIVCSPAAAINLSSERIFGRRTVAKSGEDLTEATFDLNGYINASQKEPLRYLPYIRISVTDAHGNTANTRPYTLEELI
ncbi:MAG: PHP domain-containing protein [Clostridia bacterium]|nr:PHP domain-containing protein [Clostridia bacterium]